MALRIFLFLLVFSLAGCASLTNTVRIVDLDMPLAHIKKSVVAAMPAGMRRTDSKSREFFSKYFRIYKGKFIESKKTSYRYFSQVSIRGTMRPYTVEVRVFKEQVRKGSPGQLAKYEVVSQNDKIAKAIRKRIQQALTKRREDSDNIDDFRVF